MYKNENTLATELYGYKPYQNVTVPQPTSGDPAQYGFIVGPSPSVGIVAGDTYRTLFVHLNGSTPVRLFTTLDNWQIDSTNGNTMWDNNGANNTFLSSTEYHGINIVVENTF